MPSFQYTPQRRCVCTCLDLARVCMLMYWCSISIHLYVHVCVYMAACVPQCICTCVFMWVFKDACNVYVWEWRVKISHSLHSGRSISHSPHIRTHTCAHTQSHLLSLLWSGSVQTWAILRQLVKYKTKRQMEIINGGTARRADTDAQLNWTWT